MPPADDVTPGEILRWLKRLESGQAETNKKIDGLAFVRHEVYEADKHTADANLTGLGNRLEARVDELDKETNRRFDEQGKAIEAVKDNLRWVVRTIAAAFVVAIVGLIIRAAVG